MVAKLDPNAAAGRTAESAESRRAAEAVQRQAVKGSGDFAATLARETGRLDALKISSHAQKRLNSSSVTLTESDIERLDGAVARATDKGSNQSLIMLDDLALIVSIKNRVVITAVEEARAKEGIFTNIDSVVIA